MVFILVQFLSMVCKSQHISLFIDMTLASKVKIKNLNSCCKLVKLFDAGCSYILHTNYLRCVDVNNGFWTSDTNFDSNVNIQIIKLC